MSTLRFGKPRQHTTPGGTRLTHVVVSRDGEQVALLVGTPSLYSSRKLWTVEVPGRVYGTESYQAARALARGLFNG